LPVRWSALEKKSMDNVGRVLFKLLAGVFCGFDNHNVSTKKITFVIPCLWSSSCNLFGLLSYLNHKFYPPVQRVCKDNRMWPGINILCFTNQ